MDKQKLPIKVLEELEELSKLIRENIDAVSFRIEIKEEFGLSVYWKKDAKFFFLINDYSQRKTKIIYKGEFYPFSELIHETKIFSGSWLSDVKKYLIKWVSLTKRYEKYLNLEPDTFFQFKADETSLQPDEDIFEEKDKILPFCLKSLSVINFQGIKHASIENLPVDTQWVFLVGENGFGKSTVLQSIMLGLHGSKDGNYEIIQNQDIRIQVEYKSDKENFINDCWRNAHPLAHLAAYGPSRLNLQGDIDITEEERRSLVTYGLFFTNGNLLNINAELYKWALKKDKRFELVKKAFCKLIPYLSDVRPNKETDQIEYIEKDILEGTETYEPLPYQKLASGFRAIIGIAGDMIIRLSRSQPKVTDPAKLKGIVIIDELDLHWHPKLQKQIPQLFSSVFPKVQFIVSTHSPIPLLGAPHNSVILKVTRTKEEGVKIERVDVDLKYLTPNLILTSGIFDMDDVLSVENDDLTKTRTEDTFEEMKHNDEVDDYLAEFEKSNRQFPDELFEPKAN